MLAAIVESKIDPHAAALKCRDCGRFRQWLRPRFPSF
jgi:hypothetical protein